MWNISFLPSQNICSHSESNAEGSKMTSGPSVYSAHAHNHGQEERHYHLCHSRRASAMSGLNGIKCCSSCISKCLICSDSLKKNKRECLYCIVKSVNDRILPVVWALRHKYTNTVRNIDREACTYTLARPAAITPPNICESTYGTKSMSSIPPMR